MGPRSPLLVVVAFLGIGLVVFASVSNRRREAPPAPPPPPAQPVPRPQAPLAVAAPPIQNKPPAKAPLRPGDKVRLKETWIAATSWVMTGRVNELIRAKDSTGLNDLVSIGHAAFVPQDAIGRMIVARPWFESFELVEFRIEHSSNRDLIGESVVVPRAVIQRYDGELLPLPPIEPDRNLGFETLEAVRDRLPKEAPAAPALKPPKPMAQALSREELEGRAQRKMRLAEQYHRNGFDNDALLLVKEILSLYPDTPSAQKAKELREKISPRR